MKTILLSILLLTSTSIFAQSMTLSHSGITPNSELTVTVGQSIEFIHGGGGQHPMTEGWQSGEYSTPIPFATQTVSFSNPSVTFTLDTPGVYYFHCGTNPANDDLWGKITVLDSGAGVLENQMTRVVISPNPVVDVLSLSNIEEEVFIYDTKGEMMMKTSSKTVDVSQLPSGVYIVKSKSLRSKFIKQ
ncbi:MAG: T9SS type A sorting domain-containing protein [Crocinitomicaceae bacterium]|nr:T9SS type A sorting domain-containing protein [Crocinitomicaceae bacterium]MDG1776283.1 T9SS type A sorting domain-containing protein [Crocinitomicaceae bacterium]